LLIYAQRDHFWMLDEAPVLVRESDAFRASQRFKSHQPP
jgi:hypothetical protein